MMDLGDLLAIIPGVYDDLEAAMVPAASHRGDGGTRGDALNRPAPARLEVIEHRHLLLRGLRWWVDAVRDTGDRRRAYASSVTWLCGCLFDHLDAMDPDDRATMHEQLDAWYGGALAYRGAMDDRTRHLPAGASDREITQALAAQILGCSVSTVWRRAGKRPGPVRLADIAPRCIHDLVAPCCVLCAPGA